MTEIKLQKKKVPFWPWLVGLAAAAVIVYGISRLVTSRAINQIVGEDSGSVANGGTGALGSGDTPPPPLPSSSLEALLPLGTEDLGQRVAVNGEVVGIPSAEGFWVLSDENVVIFVRGAPPAKLGAREENVMGLLAAAKPGEADRWQEAAKLKEARGWTMTRNMYVRVGNLAAKDSIKAAADKGKKPASKHQTPAKPPPKARTGT
jgi:hypothetical protein